VPLPAQISAGIDLAMSNEISILPPGSEYRRDRTWLRVLLEGAAIILISAVLGLAVNYFRSEGLPLAARPSADARPTTSAESGEGLSIPIEEAEALFYTQTGMFIDARPEDLYLQGHIQGALNLPSNALDARLSEVMAGVPLDTDIITYCDGTGCNSSKEVAFALMDNGYTNVRVLINGWTVWQKAQLPTEK
jgi:rhodanese-related sulfurtransferase